MFRKLLAFFRRKPVAPPPRVSPHIIMSETPAASPAVRAWTADPLPADPEPTILPFPTPAEADSSPDVIPLPVTPRLYRADIDRRERERRRDK